MTWGTGIHQFLDIDEYHSQCCPGVSISSSGLREIVATCPARYWATSDLNPNRVKRETEALSLGKAAHALVLGEPAFNAKFVVAPFDKFTTKESREWRDDQKRQIVRASELVTIEQMVAAQRSSDQVAHAFINGEPEMSIIWQDPETEIWLKARPDWLPNDLKTEFIVEYKTAANIAPRALSFNAFAYGYHLQAAMVWDGIVAITGSPPFGIAHAVQEKTAPFLAELRMFQPQQIEFGRQQYRHALHIFVDCLKKNSWPGYTAGPSFFETPIHVKRMMENPDEYAARYGSDAYGFTTSDLIVTE